MAKYSFCCQQEKYIVCEKESVVLLNSDKFLSYKIFKVLLFSDCQQLEFYILHFSKTRVRIILETELGCNFSKY